MCYVTFFFCFFCLALFAGHVLWCSLQLGKVDFLAYHWHCVSHNLLHLPGRVCVCACAACACVRVRERVRMFAFINACIRTCIHACVHTYMYACMHACMHACIHVHMYAHKHVHVGACATDIQGSNTATPAGYALITRLARTRTAAIPPAASLRCP